MHSYTVKLDKDQFWVEFPLIEIKEMNFMVEENSSFKLFVRPSQRTMPKKPAKKGLNSWPALRCSQS